MKKLISLALFLFLILAAGQAGAVELTAKAYGMGGAFTGLATDVSSVIYNPAGLNQSGFIGAQINGGFFTPSIDELSSLRKLADDMDDFSVFTLTEIMDKFPQDARLDGQVLAGANFKNFAFAYNINNDLSSYKIGDIAGLENMITKETIITYGNKLVSPPLNLGTLSYGVSLKLVSKEMTGYKVINDPTEPVPGTTEINASGSGVGLDVGMMGKITEYVTVGFQVKNLLASDYDMEGEEQFSNFDKSTGDWTDAAPIDYSRKVSPERVMRVGGSVRFPLIGLTVAGDIDNFPLLTDNEQDPVLHLGVEKNLILGVLSLRAGTFNQPDGQYYTFGLGANILALHLDAALGSNDWFKDSVSGVISANMKF